jgi:hypothetical protein
MFVPHAVRMFNLQHDSRSYLSKTTRTFKKAQNELWQFSQNLLITQKNIGSLYITFHLLFML